MLSSSSAKLISDAGKSNRNDKLNKKSWWKENETVSNKSNVIQIPQHEIDALARCLLPDLIAFYESEDGQREFEQWKKDLENKENE